MHSVNPGVSGKLPPDSLEKNVLAYCGMRRKEVLVGAAVGEDAAVIQWPPDKFMVFASDPIVGASENAGKLLVRVNINDIASKGGDPAFMVVTMILPPQIRETGAAVLMRQIHEECVKYGISVVGGHTEFNDRYDHPVLMGAMIGMASKVLRAEDIRVGDVILITHHLGIEGLSILAADNPGLLGKCLTLDELQEVRSWSEQTCILEASRLVRDKAKFMHDPTEGGFWGGVNELSRLCGLGVQLDHKSIPVHPLTAKLARYLHFDPLHLIASGSLMIILDSADVVEVLKRFEGARIPCVCIGEMVEENGDRLPETHEELWNLLKRD